MPTLHPKALILCITLALLLASCGQAAGDSTIPETTIAQATTVDTPDPADSEPTAVLLERHAQAIMLAPPGPFVHQNSFNLSENKTVIAVAIGDLNGDGKPDLAATVEIMPEGDRETYVLLAEKDGYKVRHTNQGLVLRADEGGVWGDPFEGLKIEDGILTISLYGGSNWRWAYQYQFKYSGSKLALIKTESVQFFTGTNEGTKIRCNYIRGIWESRSYSEEDDGQLLETGTFDPVPSTFDEPVLCEHCQ